MYYLLDHTHKRITLLPDKLADDSRAIITALFARGDKMEELNPKEANDILLRASPRDVCVLINLVFSYVRNNICF